MVRKLIKIGNSIGVTISCKELDILGLELGDEVVLETDFEKRIITIKPIAVAKDQVSKGVVTGMKKFVKKYPKALKNLTDK